MTEASLNVTQGRNLTWDDPIDWVELGVFTDKTEIYKLLMVLVGSVQFFYVLYKAIEQVMPQVAAHFGGPDNYYGQMPPKVKSEYVSRVVSDLHSFMALGMSWYGCFYVCEDETKTIFTSYECVMKPAMMQKYVICLSTGYCIYDTLICVFEIKWSFKQGFDNYFHHLISIAGALGVLVSGRFCIALSAGNLVSEFSNAAMNLRWRFLKHKLFDTWAFIWVSTLFMVSFIMSRGIFMLMLLVRNYEVQQIFDVSTEHPMIMYLIYWNTFCQIGLYGLQVFWLKVIFAGFFKTVFGSNEWLVKEESKIQEKMKADAEAKAKATPKGSKVELKPLVIKEFAPTVPASEETSARQLPPQPVQMQAQVEKTESEKKNE